MKLSARNKLAGTYVAFTNGEAISSVQLEVAGQRLAASITVGAVEDFGLQAGVEVLAVGKAPM